MGLEQFIDGLESEENSDQTVADKEPGNPWPDYNYSGEKELLDVTEQNMIDVLDSTDFGFKQRNHPIGGINYSVESENGKFYMVATYPRESMERDCIVFSIHESSSMYHAVEPHPVYMVPGWEEQLNRAINGVVEMKDDIIICDRCEAVMIIRKTNHTEETIRGCTNHPECRNKEVLYNGT